MTCPISRGFSSHKAHKPSTLTPSIQAADKHFWSAVRLLTGIDVRDYRNHSRVGSRHGRLPDGARPNCRTPPARRAGDYRRGGLGHPAHRQSSVHADPNLQGNDLGSQGKPLYQGFLSGHSQDVERTVHASPQRRDAAPGRGHRGSVQEPGLQEVSEIPGESSCGGFHVRYLAHGHRRRYRHPSIWTK